MKTTNTNCSLSEEGAIILNSRNVAYKGLAIFHSLFYLNFTDIRLTKIRAIIAIIYHIKV